MMKYIFIALFSLLGYGCLAQNADSLIAIRKDGSWAIKYTMKPGETIRMLALRFSVSEAIIATENEVATIKNAGAGTIINIPVISHNYFSIKQPLANVKELYYRVGYKDDIANISTYSGVTKDQMRSWNNLKGNTIMPDQVLFIGWVKMIPKDTANPVTLLAYPSNRKRIAADTSRYITLGGLDSIYARQTSNGTNVLTEKGTAVFFEKTGKGGVYLAFHNTARRGTIIKVTNPGNGRSIYVKVLGPIPGTKQYANSIIGIADGAKEALGVSESKAWCELSYSAN
jgi:LysM repeat protein